MPLDFQSVIMRDFGMGCQESICFAANNDNMSIDFAQNWHGILAETTWGNFKHGVPCSSEERALMKIVLHRIAKNNVLWPFFRHFEN